MYKCYKVDLRTKFGSKIPIRLSDDMTRAVGEEARNLVNYCGYVVRTTISFRHGAEWNNIYEHFKDEMILKVKVYSFQIFIYIFVYLCFDNNFFLFICILGQIRTL